jgi:itaconyl-CoA hydratase
MNTAHAHFNEHAMKGTPFGQRLVFGLVTGSIVIGLATQDTVENAIAEVGLDKMRFTAPVFHGDTLYAYTEVLGREESERKDAGIVRFRHWGVKVGPEEEGRRKEEGVVVFEAERTVLVKRRQEGG